jgi:outer membrane protein insertion porin family
MQRGRIMNGKYLLEELPLLAVRIVRWGTFLLSSFLVAPSTSAQQGAVAGLKIPKENISFIGNKSFAAEDLKAIFRSAGTVTAQLPPQFMDTYNNDRIVHASNMVLAFYRNRGFLKAVVSPPDFDLGSPGSAAMTLVLKITEHNPYQLGVVKVTGATVLRETVVASMLNLQPKAIANLAKINAGILAVREAYLALGYLDVQINPSLDAAEGKKVADLRVDLVEGEPYHLGRIELAGKSPIDVKLLHQLLPLQPGDLFGRKAFEACLDTLNELGTTPLLTANDVSFAYDKPKALVDVTIHLEGKNAP